MTRRRKVKTAVYSGDESDDTNEGDFKITIQPSPTVEELTESDSEEQLSATMTRRRKVKTAVYSGEESDDTNEGDFKITNQPSPTVQELTESDNEEEQISETKGEEHTKKNDKEDTYRTCVVGPKEFKFKVARKNWIKIKPEKGKRQLRPPWTDIFYNEFRKSNPSCTLAFKYQNIRTRDSRKKKSPYLRATAKCTFEGCEAVYTFTRKGPPKYNAKKITVMVTRFGEVKHLKSQRKCRPARYLRRGKIAKAVKSGVSNCYYELLKNTPVEEIMAGNITRSLTKDVLKIISYEIRSVARLHNDQLLELMLTQRIIRESGRQTRHASSNGYLQLLQIDPFATHLYTDAGLQILAEHLRGPMPTTLYLDATGGVVQKVPHQSKRVLYYALVLPGMGKDKPPLPVAEFVTNSHSVPSISHWLMEFNRRLSHITGRKIAQIETDYSWALMNSVLISFNHEDVSAYLCRAFEIVSGQLKVIPKFTVLHLCSAHILKAVSQAFGRTTSDRGIKEYATYSFAYLLNCTSLPEALEVFYHMCVLFDAEQHTDSINTSERYLNGCILQSQHMDIEETQEGSRICDSSDPSNGILARSPFMQAFDLRREQATCDVLSDEEADKNNNYHCPGIINVLLKTYMGIFPLWSGVLLADLSRHSKGSITRGTGCKTRETNCHVELWFRLVKHSILCKRKYLRPAEFVSKMFASVQGRYVEHVIQQSLPIDVLQRNLQSSVKLEDDPEEQWCKRDTSSGSSKRKSKYFNPPKNIPNPKTKTKSKKIIKVEQNQRVEDAQVSNVTFF